MHVCKMTKLRHFERRMGALALAQALFGKTADSLERSTENEDEYMIHEREVMTTAVLL